jgi:adenosine deaminase
MAEGTDVTRKELVQFARNSFLISWISGWKRNHYLQMLDDFERRALGVDDGGKVEGGS